MVVSCETYRLVVCDLFSFRRSFRESTGSAVVIIVVRIITHHYSSFIPYGHYQKSFPHPAQNARGA